MMIKGVVHILKIIIEDMIPVLDQGQDHIQEKKIHQNIDIQIIMMIKNIVSTNTITIEDINIVKDIIKIIQIEKKVEVKIDIKKKKKNL